ncbi:STAS domain-containing protein [Methanofollis fontis]|uniref:Anti-sigma factor antagonist n=1 Tax=Methanofollis fontis TaxID=2052832 RepID=A0A483CML5_9EURY|nr:STAS domain-containing protein [Methanofollis fontis]TAJ43852.1 anti-sigma factor antagonist [Methanofollis fontis]
MEITTERQDGIPVIGVKGRFDGYTAGKVDEALDGALRDDDRSTVIDLEGTTYISSAGIRVILALQKLLKGRGGGTVLCGVGEYPMQVLSMAGFDRVFTICTGRADALERCHRREDSLSLIDELESPSVEYEGIRFRFERGSPRDSVLKVTGSLDDLLHSRLSAGDIRAEPFSGIRYSLGLGALGAGVEDAMPLLGEMMTIHGAMIWLPTDGHDTPDFFVPAREDGGVVAYTGFNVSLEGGFQEFALIEPSNGDAISLDALYRAVFARGRERTGGFSGIVAVAVWGVAAGVESSGIRRSPCIENAPADGSSILDEGMIEDWMDIDTEPRYDGDSIVTFGVGVDLSADLCAFDPSSLTAISYTHPAEGEGSGAYLHNHGVVFRNVLWEAESDLEQGIGRCLEEGEFVDMRHLLDSTRLHRARIGIAYIQEIRIS